MPIVRGRAEEHHSILLDDVEAQVLLRYEHLVGLGADHLESERLDALVEGGGEQQDLQVLCLPPHRLDHAHRIACKAFLLCHHTQRLSGRRSAGNWQMGIKVLYIIQ